MTKALLNLGRCRLGHAPAGLADQESDRRRFIVAMRAGHKGIARGQTVHQAVFEQKIERPINGDGRWPFSGRLGDQIDHFIGPDRPAGRAKLVENKLPGRREFDVIMRMGAVRMIVHGASIGIREAGGDWLATIGRCTIVAADLAIRAATH